MELYSHDAEQRLIGVLLKDSSLMPQVSAISKNHFYFSKHEIIFEAIASLWQAMSPIDIVSVASLLEERKQLSQVGGNTYLAQAIEASFGLQSVDSLVDIIIKRANLRFLQEFFLKKQQQIKDGSATDYQEIITETHQLISGVSEAGLEKNTSVKDVCANYTKLQEEYAEQKLQGRDHLGVPTGIKSLDKAIDGYRPEHLWAISAFTSIGKTSFMCNLVYNLLKQDKKVCIFSLEMSKEDMFSKLLAIDLELSPNRITKGLLETNIYQKQVAAKSKLASKNLSIYGECTNVEDIVAAMQAEVIKNGTEVFFLDYIQNVTSKRFMDEYHLLTTAIKSLQMITRKLKTTLVILSQISNESNKSNSMLDIGGKGTGAIKSAANLFVYLKREGTEEEVMEKYRTGEDIALKAIINKNRHGRVGSFPLKLKQESGIMYETI